LGPQDDEVYTDGEKIMLSRKESVQKRDELIELGYTIVPGVMQDPFLSEVREWTDAVMDRVEVDPKFRYQGSDVQIMTPERWPESRERTDRNFPDAFVERISELPEAKQICRDLGLEGIRSHQNAILLSKPPFGPPLYWHQDHMNWNHPESLAPWPLKVFLSYYMTDTTKKNGCLRVLPGTHLKRIPLHDNLPNAHEPEIQAIEDLDHRHFRIILTLLMCR
jgi:ectoine hydroxylase-related dioxygenase (phytanoyl-CoA dioxygenase family)